MEISSSSLLNILLPNDNKVLKETLQKADTSTLENMIKGKNVSVNQILKNLFEEIKSGTKTNSNVENILKNSNLFKDLGSFSNNLLALLKNLETTNDTSLEKFKPLLESFLKDIKEIDSNNLKEQISKSGIFLESKMFSSSKGENNPINKVLSQIQNIIKDINTPESKKINDIINKIVSPQLNLDGKSNNIKNILKELVINLKNLNINNNTSSPQIQNLAVLTNKLTNLIDEGILLESKIENKSFFSSKYLEVEIKNLLKQLKEEFFKVPTVENRNNISKIDNLLKNETILQDKTINKNLKELLVSFENKTTSNKNIDNLVTLLKNSLTQINQVNLEQENLPIMKKEAILTEALNENKNSSKLSLVFKEQINNQTKDLLKQIKQEFTQNIPSQSKNIISQIDNLLETKDLFIKNEKMIEPKELLNKLITSNEMKNLSTLNKNISNILVNLKNIYKNIITLENKALNSTNIVSEKQEILNNLKINIENLKIQTHNIQGYDSKNLMQTISKLENLQNIFTKIENPKSISQNTAINSFVSNFSTNLNSLLVSLKDTLVSIEQNPNTLNIQNNILKAVDEIEKVIKNLDTQHNTTQANTTISKNENTSFSNDMKALLLQVQEELSSKQDVKSQEVLKQVDKLLMQIDYQQLSSLASNSNFVYVPFLWDMLEEGTINMKKLKEEKFYCQINLNLKDFGKLDLMLALYDKNKLDLTIQAQREHFKLNIKDNLKKLKQALNSVDLIPVNIKLLDIQDKKEQSSSTKAYIQNNYYQEPNSGINIKV